MYKWPISTNMKSPDASFVDPPIPNLIEIQKVFSEMLADRPIMCSCYTFCEMKAYGINYHKYKKIRKMYRHF